jgi:transcription initiation factor TFIIIB Brf1 subunit/transcription initiation factor TFIIB
MICPYCGSSRVAVSSGEYVCTDCGSVIGPVLYVPRRNIQIPIDIKKISLKFLLYKLNKETIIYSKNVKYKDRIKQYIESLAKDLDAPGYILNTSIKVLESIDKRKIQGKNPRVVAGTIFYLVSNRYGLSYDKNNIAKRLNISKLSIRDTAVYLKKICKELR